MEQEQSVSEDDKKELQIGLAVKAVEEALSDMNIPRLTDDSEFPNPRWDVFYQGEGKEIVLTVRFHPIPGAGWLHVPIAAIAWLFLVEVQTVLSNPEASKTLISDESDYETAVHETTKQFAVSYIAQLPTVIFHALHQTVNEAIISQIKKFIEPGLREHWQKLNLPKKFTLVPDNRLSGISELFPDVKLPLLGHLDLIEREFSVHRKGAFSDRKIWLNPQARANLPAEYERLRTEYGKMRSEHKTQRKAFFTINRRGDEEAWETHWKAFCDETFPNLFLDSEVMNYSAGDLAYKHLAEVFDFSPTYMAKMVGDARARTEDISVSKDPDPLRQKYR